MSSGCGDVLSLADLQTAKKHQIFEAEVITGKSGGVAGGADIDYATNQITGQTQKTLPAVLRGAGFSPVSWDFSTGGTLTVNDRDKVVYDPVSKTWYSYAGTLPVVVPASFNPVGNANWKPQTDQNLRNDLASSTAGLGASLVSFSNGNTVETLSDADGAKNIGSGERSLLARNNDIKHSGDFSTLQAAVDASLTKNDLIVSPGEYTEAITLGSKQIKGVGGAAILKPSANYANTVQVNLSTPHWQFRHSGGFAVDGTGTTGAVGISFDPSDQYSGRHNFSDLYIHNINKAIQKPSGNIGNTWRSIGVSTCDWGYYAISGSEMHCGADTLYNIHFDGISTYAVYLNGTVDNGGIGGWWLKDSIIEASGGGGIYLKSKSGDCPTSPCGVSNVWMEAIATSSAVQVDGVAQKPRVLKLVDTTIFFAEYSYLNNIELSNSNLVTYGCRFDNADGNQDIVVDAQSTIVAHDVYLNGSSGKDVIVESVASQSATIATTNLSLRGNLTRGRLFNTPTGNKLKAITFDSGSHNFSGSGTVNGSTVSDGLHAATCTEFSFPGSGLYEMVASRTTLTSGRWYVWGVNSRLQSGTADVSITLGITMGSVYTKSGEWISTFGVGKASTNGIVGLYVSTGGGSGAVIRFSDFFIAEFTTQAQALAFANSRMSLA